MKKPRFNAKLLALWLLVCFVLGGTLSWVSGMPLWAAILIVAAALLINGLIAEVEDRAPGGFLNPRKGDK